MPYSPDQLRLIGRGHIQHADFVSGVAVVCDGSVVGGLGFFAFVLAPVAFHSLPNAHEAGVVVGGSLRILHWIGLVGGTVFYVATGLLWLRAGVTARAGFAIEMILAGLMMAGTFYSQFRILPTMEADRVLAGGAVETAPPDNVGRVDFERLHRLSERVEGLILFCGLGLVFLLSRESQQGAVES